MPDAVIQSWRVTRVSGALTSRAGDARCSRISGHVRTPLGIVAVWASRWANEDGTVHCQRASFEMVARGREFRLNEDIPTFSERALAIRAHRFIQQVQRRTRP